jgi:glycosyltransferase involved in cell wall biosynthesis
MKILIATPHYGGPNRSPWLLDDLARQLAESGHIVDVIIFDPTRGRSLGTHQTDLSNLAVYSVGTEKNRQGSVNKLIGYLSTCFKLHAIGFKWVKDNKYDLCISTTIAAFNWGFPGRIRRRGISTHNLIFVWDFFPIHHMEIGRIRAVWLTKLMKFIERLAINQNDTVALMSPANKAFFHNYHPSLEPRTIEIPPWTSSKNVGLYPPQELPLKVIFGGQLAKGRGVDTLLDAASLLLNSSSDLMITIAGDGPDRNSLEAYAHNLKLTNVNFVGNLPRDDYRNLAAKSHIGIAITVPGISPPTFPSKIAEYLSLGLPVIVCVEASSDAGDFVFEGNAGYKVDAGDAIGLAARLEDCIQILKSGQMKSFSVAAQRLFENRLSVTKVVNSLEAVLNKY